MNRSREWARAIVEARAARTVALITQAIAEKKSSWRPVPPRPIYSH